MNITVGYPYQDYEKNNRCAFVRRYLRLWSTDTLMYSQWSQCWAHELTVQTSHLAYSVARRSKWICSIYSCNETILSTEAGYHSWSSSIGYMIGWLSHILQRVRPSQVSPIFCSRAWGRGKLDRLTAWQPWERDKFLSIPSLTTALLRVNDPHLFDCSL